MVASRALGEPVDTLAAGVRGRWRFVCSLGLSSVLVVLCSLVHATPPDPLWIPGIYDDADYDDAVVAVFSATGLVVSPDVPGMPAAIAAGGVQSHDAVLGATPLCCSFFIRGPPSGRVVIPS